MRGSPEAIRLSYCLRSEDSHRGDALRRICTVLRVNHGDIKMAALELGVGRATLHRWAKEHEAIAAAIYDSRKRAARKAAAFAARQAEAKI